MKRTFTTAGQKYVVQLVATNLEDQTDTMYMNWEVICANPINPPDWSIIYPPYLRPTDTFNITFKIKPNVPLPTM